MLERFPRRSARVFPYPEADSVSEQPMTTLLTAPPRGVAPQLAMPPDIECGNPVHRAVETILRQAAPTWHQPNRRRLPRHPYPKLIDLAPADDMGPIAGGERVIVIGKNISLDGLDFYHQQPLAHRHVTASFELAADLWIHLLLDITWCRFLRDQWYDSGGRFVRIISQTEFRDLDSK